ncbi:MAG: ParB/RepB/Spo0J family partition protein [Clostridia bacterium]|nr:ParB/RepB/Spo0J family partition protein [Clostridia bacterium]
MKQEITFISTDRLIPHPDNPRKDLGDLTELAESIKVNGILQNLTVVPSPTEVGEYRVIIGHRRLAAAKQAGLTVLPCVVAYMTPKEQLATMMTENLQRSDLTIIEQAHGFQMMLDFGDSVEMISEKTGFSQTTVRRRIKLIELDQGKLKKASQRQLSLTDLDRLNKVEDIKVRNKLLDAIGTSNFEYEIKKALDNQEKAQRKACWDKRLSEFAIRLEKADYTKERVAYITIFRKFEDVTLPADTDEIRYYYYIDEWGGAYLYKDRVIDDEETERQNAELAMRAKVEEQKSKLREIALRMYELRYAFIKEYKITKKSTKEIGESFISASRQS